MVICRAWCQRVIPAARLVTRGANTKSPSAFEAKLEMSDNSEINVDGVALVLRNVRRDCADLTEPISRRIV